MRKQSDQPHSFGLLFMYVPSTHSHEFYWEPVAVSRPFGDSNMNQICVLPFRSSPSSEGDNDLNINNHNKKKTIDKPTEEAKAGCLIISKNSWSTAMWDLMNSPVNPTGLSVSALPIHIQGPPGCIFPKWALRDPLFSWVASPFKTCPSIQTPNQEVVSKDLGVPLCVFCRWRLCW